MKKPEKLFASPLPRFFATTCVADGLRCLYGLAIVGRNWLYDTGARQPLSGLPIPVISIGGIRAGGTGKTPTTMFLIDYFTRQGLTVGVLSRGYRRKSDDLRIVSPQQYCTWEEVGDEPAMMRSVYPQLWLGIGADRRKNATVLAEQLREQGVLLMDDGFQHRKLGRDLDIVCIHDTLFTDKLLPQGYLREPVASLSRADCFFCITDHEGLGNMRKIGERLATEFPQTLQVFLVSTVEGWVNAATGELSQRPPFKNPTALCGIARPERFFNLINRQGIICSRKMAFPDHYIFRERDIVVLRKLYSQGIITTEKDMVRLAAIDNLPKEQVWYCKIRLRTAEKDSLHGLNRYIKRLFEM